MDPMAELAYDFTPYRYGFNNPVYFGDPSGLFETEMQANAFAFSNGIDRNHYKIEANSELGGFNLVITGGEFKGTTFYDYAEMLPEVLVNATRGGGGAINLQAGAGDIMRTHVYSNSQYYQYHRDQMWSQQWDRVQNDLDYLGTIPIAGEAIDLINGGISLVRGDYVGAGLSVGAMIPFAGNGFTVAKLGIRIQKHHIIPKAVYRDADKAVKNIMELNGGFNLKKLPTPFHGNHPQYNKYVTEQLRNLNEVTPGSIKTLQKDLSGQINNAYDNYKKTGENLNDYFRKINNN